jgi:hypothetical protein
VQRRFLLPGFELLVDLRISGRELDDTLVGLDREIQITLAVRDLAEHVRRLQESRVRLHRALQK